MNEQLKQIIEDSKRIVFFGGAGVSTESNIPDFRSETGLYNAQRDYGHSPEEMLSHSFFMQKTQIFFDYYKNNLIYREAMPNRAHLALAKLEEEGKLIGVVTQNIDGLHQKAGSKNVFELHGSVMRNFCMKCGKAFDLDYVMDESHCTVGVPKCDCCGGIVKPDVVLYEEGLDSDVMNESLRCIAGADVLIIGGTSLVVYPAAGLIDYFQGSHLVLINKSATARDTRADLVITDPIGEVFSQIRV
jgi:NAD-dependent deacetylase